VVPGQLFRLVAERALEHRNQSSQASEAWGQRGLEAEQAASKVLAHIEVQGMSVKWVKSLLQPTQQTTIIGLSLDLVLMRAPPTVERFMNCYSLLSLTVQTWLRLLGMLAAASAITLLGLLHLLPLQKWFNSLHILHNPPTVGWRSLAAHGEEGPSVPIVWEGLASIYEPPSTLGVAIEMDHHF